MKKNALHIALLALTFPMSLFAIGLGEMTIESSLDQPFLAEIELIDVGSAPLIGIKVGVADPENFERIGLVPIAALSLLQFKIEKNDQGKVVIKVQSLERMTEPYMELVVDLTWPTGQLYKAYTVLLDPPGYQLVSSKAQSSPTYYKKARGRRTEPGVINKAEVTVVEHHPVNLNDKKKKTTYGPTLINDNLWQIAQRYKTSELILPQVVLAIVGANPDAFKEGNLNGLIVGMRLVVPATQEIALIPAELATQEVMAHDNAWNKKTTINHVLTPPYMSGQKDNPGPESHTTSSNVSQIPSIPKFTLKTIGSSKVSLPKLISTNLAIPVVNTYQTQPNQKPPLNLEQDATIKTEISITTAAVESVRESNALLMEQLHLLQDQNKKLQVQLDKRDKEMMLIQSQLQVMMKERLAVASHANTIPSNDHSSSLCPLLLLLFLAAGGGGLAYWYFKLREQEHNEDPYLSNPLVEPKRFIPGVEVKSIITEEVVAPAIIETPVPDITLIEDNEHIDEQVSEVKPDEDLVKDKEVTESELIETKIKPEKNQEDKKKKDIFKKDDQIIETDLYAELQGMIPHSEGVTSEVKEEPMLEFEKNEEQKSTNDIIPKNPMPEENQIIANTYETKSQSHSDEAQEELESPTQDLLEFESGLHQLLPEESEHKTIKDEDSDEKKDGLDFESSIAPGHNIQKKSKLKQSIKPKTNNIEEQEQQTRPLDLHSEELDFKKEPEVENKNIEITPDISEFFVETKQEQITEDDKIVNESPTETTDKSESDSTDKTGSPLKSKAALDTLLDLAKTYIGMDDIESARFSLQEVMEYGSDSQKIEANNLLDELKDK